MTDNFPSNKSKNRDVNDFLAQVAKSPRIVKSNANGRLIFAMDATASREPMWDLASHIQAEMFKSVSDIGGLSIQLCYYRGFNEFQSFEWTDQAPKLLNSISSVRCLAGKTQISKVFRHALEQSQHSSVQALVFIGDAMEENVDKLGNLAGQLGIYKTPIFCFQEGKDPVVSRAFQQFSQLSGGAHCTFDSSSAHILAGLLKAVARYSVGGLHALKNDTNECDEVKQLTQHRWSKK